MSFQSIKTITLEDMKDYIEKEDKNGKAEFKANAIVNGKYNHLKATRYFCKKYFPNLIPTKKEELPNKSDFLKDW